MSAPIRMTLTRLALAITPVLLLPGCASTEPASQQASQQDPRLASIELSLHQAALAAQQAGERADAALARVHELEARLAQQENKSAAQNTPRINGTLLETLTLTGDQYLYPLNAVELDGKDGAQLDQLAARLKSLDHPYFLEIQGHTGDSGNGEYNYLLGEARAKAVSRYLHNQGGIPLHNMSAISYGAAKPVAAGPKADNAKGGRRVVVLVYQ